MRNAEKDEREIRFAGGLLVLNEDDMTGELIMLKDMIMDKFAIREKRD